MKMFARVALFPAVFVLPLALAQPVHAAQSALVGKLKQDGTVQLFLNRFQDHFADGTPVARIWATRTDGVVTLNRRSTDGCLAETTDLLVAAATSPDGSFGLWEVTWHGVSIFRCEDNGCAEEFTTGAWTASCGDFGSVPPYIIKCICIKRNSDQVIGEAGDYCKQSLHAVLVWDLSHWVLAQYIQ